MRHFFWDREEGHSIVAALWSARAPIAQTKRFLPETKSQPLWRDTGPTCSWKPFLVPGQLASSFSRPFRAFLIGPPLQSTVQPATFLDVAPVGGNEGIGQACEVLGCNPSDFKTIEIVVTHFG